MKKIIALISLFVIGCSLNAQDENNQISVSYGVASMQAIDETIVTIFDDMIISLLSLGDLKPTSSDVTGAGLIEFRYKYFVSEKVSFGLRAGYVKYDHKDSFTLSDGTKFTTNWNDQYITTMLDFNFYYLNNENVSLYSGVGAGASFVSSEVTSVTDPKYNSNATDNTTLLAFQLNAFGVRFGKSFGGFAELGFGYSGILNGGLYLKF